MEDRASFNQESFAAGAAKSTIREIAAYGARRKAEIGAENVFDFSLGNPSAPAPREVSSAIQELVSTMKPMELHGYTPANGLPYVRARVAEYLSDRFGLAIQADDLYFTCGAAASLTVTLNALVNPGDEVIVIAPYFPEYKVWIETAGATCVQVDSVAESFMLDLEAIRRAITPKTKAIIINSPNNPTGVIYPKESLEALAELLQEAETQFGHDIFMISDEPYRELVYTEYAKSEVSWVPSLYHNAIVCYSYSKALSLPGERIGWVLVSPKATHHSELVAAVAGSGRKLGFVCAPALFQHVLARVVDIKPDISAYSEPLNALYSALTELGFHVATPEGAFYLWLKSPEADAKAFAKRAMAYELLLVPGDDFGCPGWVRISYCVPSELAERSIAAFEKLAQSYQLIKEAQ